MESITNEGARRLKRGSNAVRFDASKLNAAFASRKISNGYAAKVMGISPQYLSAMKRRGTITQENRSRLRNVLGIMEEEYLINSVQVSEQPKAEVCATQDMSMDAYAQHARKAHERNALDGESQDHASGVRADYVILLRREELKSIVREAVMDMLKSMVGGAA